MSSVLQVSRSGYYSWVGAQGKPSQKRQAQQAMDAKVKLAFDNSKQRNGTRRIQVDLAKAGSSHDVKTIASSMARQGLVAKAARKFKVTTDSKHAFAIAPNLLKREFETNEKNTKWAGDITYLYTSEGWLYLAVIIDLYSRSVIGWSMSTRMTADLVCDALKMALKKRHHPQGVIIHSDRGSQYCSAAYRTIIKEHNLKQSMSRKGNCWDNACVESFFHSMKVEAIQYESLMNRSKMRQHIFEYIEVDYNRKRRHSALGYLSPENYEKKNNA